MYKGLCNGVSDISSLMLASMMWEIDQEGAISRAIPEMTINATKSLHPARAPEVKRDVTLTLYRLEKLCYNANVATVSSDSPVDDSLIY